MDERGELEQKLLKEINEVYHQACREPRPKTKSWYRWATRRMMQHCKLMDAVTRLFRHAYGECNK